MTEPWKFVVSNDKIKARQSISAAIFNGVAVSVAEYGTVGDGVTDDTAAIQSAIDAVDGAAVVIPQGTYKVSGNLTIQNKANFKLIGHGATIELSGDGSVAGGRGVKLAGTLANVEIAGLHIVGDGDYTHQHKGIWGNSGANLVDISMHHNVIEQVTVGISINAELSGSIDGFQITDNVIKDVVGIATGYGYGIHCAYGANSVRGIIARNRIYNAKRHSIYVAHVADLDVVGNMIYGHRSTLTSGEQADATDGRGKTRPAVNIARSHNVRLSGNYFMDGYDAAVAIVPNPEGAVGVYLWDVALTGNHFLRPQNSVPLLMVGDSTPSTTGVPTDILVSSNDFYSDFSVLSGVNSIEAIQHNAGVNVRYKNNSIVIRGVNQTTAGINVYNREDSSGTATYTDGVEISENHCYLKTSNGSVCRGVRLDGSVSTSIAKHKFRNNTAAGDCVQPPIVLVSTATNTNLDFNAQDVRDQYGNTLFAYSGVASAAVYLTASNGSGSTATMRPDGTGSNLNFRVRGKGTGKFGIFDAADTSKVIEFDLTGLTPGNTRTLSPPNATTTLVGRDTTDTLSHKSIDLTTNTVTMTAAQLQAAVSDADVTLTTGPHPDDQLTAGMVTIPRWSPNVATVSLGASGTEQFTYFTADKAATLTGVTIRSGSTAAGATPTLVRIGLYSVAANGDLTLIASTANDTTLLAATNTTYTKAFSASATVAYGDRLAIGVLVVSGATMPTLAGVTGTGSAELAVAPRLTASLAGQSDLPSSVTAGSLSATTSLFYARVA